MHSNTNTGSSSTTWKMKKVIVSQRRQAQAGQRAGGARWSRLRPTDWRRPTGVTIKYRGGPECWVEVTARGETNYYPGWVCIYDILSDITRNMK